MALLTKSKYLLGLQCPKLLWVSVNDKERIPKPDSALEAVFETGNQIGILATSLFPEGIKVPETGFMDNINKTKELLYKQKPLFEAGFLVHALFSRADILNPNKDGSWDIIEVKSSTEVKDINIHDVSFQKYVYEKAGLEINKCFLMFINNQYVRNGPIEAEKLFTKEDITSQVEEFSTDIEKKISEMKAILDDTEPNTTIGPHCSKPYNCALTEECWSFLPNNSVFSLTRGGKKSWELFNSDIHKILDIPEDFKLTEKQKIQHNCELSKTVHINKEEIRRFLKTLQYPLYYFDFETINPAIPLYDGIRPYQRMPFQYSLHIQEVEAGEIKHISFLADETKDPRVDILEAMKRDLGTEGTILAWNEGFEKGVIKELVEQFPNYQEWANSILARFNDLIIPFKNFHYYNPVQEGSASLKKVLPALTDLSYKALEIGNGADASNSYYTICTTKMNPEDVAKIRKNLETYCELDTFAEVEILKALKKLVE